jgi:hypothetical protein
MKPLFIIILLLLASTAFSQTNDAIIEEKSSDWIKVVATVPVPKQKTTPTVKSKISSRKHTVPKQDTQEEFEKTNNQVNRFKKGKKD